MDFSLFSSNLDFLLDRKKQKEALISFFEEEGFVYELKSGILHFEYFGEWYMVRSVEYGDYAECSISYNYNLKKLTLPEKAFIANEVNKHNIFYTDKVRACAYDDVIKIYSTYTFTSRNMLLKLFKPHLDSLSSYIDNFDWKIFRVEDYIKVDTEID